MSLPVLQRFVRGGAWALAGKLAMVLTGLGTSALITRLLPPSDVGAYFLTMVVVGFGTLVASMGLGQSSVRLIAQYTGQGQSGRVRGVLRTVLILGLAGALIVAALLAVGGEFLARRLFHSEAMLAVVPLAVCGIVVATALGLMTEAFRGLQDIRLASIFGGGLAGLLTFLVFGILWWWQGQADLWTLILIWLLATGISLAVAGVWLRAKARRLDRSEAVPAGEVMTVAWPVFIIALTSFLMGRADLWIVGAFLSTKDAALYGAAVRLVMLVSMPLVVVNAVLPPLISELYFQGRRQELERMLRTTASISLVPALIVLAVFIIAGGPILAFVFGEFYARGAGILSLLGLGQIFRVLTGSCGFVLIMTGHERTRMRIALAGSALTVGLELILVILWGGVGVAGGMAAGSLVISLTTWLAVRRKVGIWTHAGVMDLKGLARGGGRP